MPTVMRLLATLAAVASLSGCYVNLGVPTPELAVKISADKSPRTGYATCTGFFGVFAVGNCTLTSAMKNGRITKVSHVDSEVRTLLFGAYSEYTVVVRGE